MKKFTELGLTKDMMDAISRLGFKNPTEIQAKTIPAVVKGFDIIGESATGSGKTLAFGCGIIERVVPGKGLQALILTPTRELAEQVSGAVKEFSYNKKLKIITVYGGVSINPQINDLRFSDVVIATPGRLLDHMQRRTVNLSKVKLLVLDEADRMLDMGFIDDVEKIIRQCSRDRQTLFFSATILPRIKALANKYMKKPIKVMARKHVDPSKLKQVYYEVHKGMKISLLVHLLKNEKAGLIMVFCNTRRNTDFVVKNLKASKIRAIAIHGGLSQNKRTRTIDIFDKGKVSVLVCTDVAARGLHIENISHIYNYDIPRDSTDYVHRIGRTARAGELGKVINLLCEYDHDNFSRILRDYSEFRIDKMKKPYIKRVNTMRTENRRPRHTKYKRKSGFKRKKNFRKRKT